MDGLSEIILTSSLTIIGGVIIYSITQLISRFVIEPIYRQKKVIGEIVDALIFYANIYSNPNTVSPEDGMKVSERLRRLSTLLQSRTYLVPFYGFCEIVGCVRRRSDIEIASKEIIGLSNSIIVPTGKEAEYVKHNLERRDKIIQALDLKVSL